MNRIDRIKSIGNYNDHLDFTPMFQLQHSLKSLYLKLSPTTGDRWVWIPPAERTTSGSRKIHTICSVFFCYHQILQTEWLIKKKGFSSSQFWRQRGSDQMQMDIPRRVLRWYKSSHGEKSSSWRWYQSELHSRSALNMTDPLTHLFWAFAV